MQVNNAIYESLGHQWWSDGAGFEISSLRYCINPVRYQYFKSQLALTALPGKSVLDIGCGGGFLSESFAADAFQATGIDPSASSIRAARKHAAEVGLAVQYHEGRGEHLPFADRSFAVVACCDVLEHVDNLARVLREVARVLQPGGILLFDTVNRTLRSWLVLIKLWQDFGLAGLPKNAHVWQKFIKPAELTAMLGDVGLTVHGMKGIGPLRRNPLALLRGLRQVRTGIVRGPAVADLFGMKETSSLAMSYMGWAAAPGRRSPV